MKSRLGIKSRLGSKLTNRIGSAILENNDRIEIFECTFDSEEEELRADALKTIDLRKRISNKEVGYLIGGYQVSLNCMFSIFTLNVSSNLM